MTPSRTVEDQLRDANRRLTAELESAARFQRTLLPTGNPSSEAFESAWFYKPSDELGGDGLNVFLIDGDKVGFYVLDVTGHGVASALLSVTATHFLSGYVKNHNHCPQELVELLNRHFSNEAFVGHSFTLVYGVVNLKDRVLVYSSAGHAGPIRVAREGAVEQFDGHGPPIGLFEDAVYGRSRVQLAPGDRIFLVSDGIYEARNASGDDYGLARVRGHLSNESVNLYPLDYTVQSLARSAFHWMNPAKPDDDISIVGVEIK